MNSNNRQNPVVSLDNLHTLQNACDFIDQRNVPAAFICFDQAKAFDRVSHTYMFEVLEACGFGPMFCAWVRLLYTEIYSSVLMNGVFV